MKFKITRTSLWNNEQPHENAILEHVENYRDVRSFKNKEEWLKKFPNDESNALEWGITDKGKPYRIVKANDYACKIWTIEIDDLCKFIIENGSVIISQPSLGRVGFEDLMELEIYDDYRE